MQRNPSERIARDDPSVAATDAATDAVTTKISELSIESTNISMSSTAPESCEVMEVSNTSSTSDTGDISAFRLLDLPAELQLRIFEFTVTEKDPITITFRVWKKYKHQDDLTTDKVGREEWESESSKAACIQPSLTRTCRSIRADAIKFYYRNNFFEAGVCGMKDEAKTTQRWLDCIGEENRKQIREFYVCDASADAEFALDEYNASGGDDYALTCLETMKTQLEEYGAQVGPLTDKKLPTWRKVTFKTEKSGP